MYAWDGSDGEVVDDDSVEEIDSDGDNEDAIAAADDESVEVAVFTTISPEEDARKQAAMRRSKKEEGLTERKRGHQLDDMVGSVRTLVKAITQPPGGRELSYVDMEKELEAVVSMSLKYPQMFPPAVVAEKQATIFAKYNVSSVPASLPPQKVRSKKPKL